MFDSNEKQRQTIRLWRKYLDNFLSDQWIPALLGGAGGALIAAATRLTLLDKNFQTYIKKSYFSNSFAFDGPFVYKPYAVVVVSIVALLLFGRGTRILRRGTRSWLVGCISGIPTFSLLSTWALLTFHTPLVLHDIIIYSGGTITFWCVSFSLYLFGRVQAERTISEADLRVSDLTRAVAGSRTVALDDPIQFWEEDALDRASVVDIITSKAMIGRASVIALSGPLGIGKTSVLNLLQTHLQDKAIVVRFVTWLPGSQDALSSYLLADIANECRKHYMIPGLRRSARRVASALAETIPIFKGTLEFIPATTQRDDVIALQDALARLPRRLIVLLDELDRMGKDEILTLLKMLRGMSQIPNCTFVCALDLDELIEVVRGNKNEDDRRYFEKFFPITVNLPNLDSEKLKEVAINRLSYAFEREEWFKNSDEKNNYSNALEECWGEMVAPFCQTLRAISLLANDIEIAAAQLRRQVDPVELTLIEALHRFHLDIYKLVARNQRILTGGETRARGGEYIPQDRRKREDELFNKELNEITKSEDAEAIKALLGRLFPEFAKRDGPFHHDMSRRNTENSNSISDPTMFSAYFQYEIPEAIFSSLELERFLTDFLTAINDTDRGAIYRAALQKFPKTSLKRDDFLRKLADAVHSMDNEHAASLALVAVSEAREYGYDLFVGFGEAGHVIRLVIRAAEKMTHDGRVEFLSRCIGIASDDTLALRITINLTDPKSDVRLDIAYNELLPAFRHRMRQLYGSTADAATMDLTTSDPLAFSQWGFQSDKVDFDPEDRNIQKEFWLRRIGNSRRKLAEVFKTFLLPPQYQYSSDPKPFVENKLPLDELERLFHELPEEELSHDENSSLLRLEKLLAGEFQNGEPLVMK